MPPFCSWRVARRAGASSVYGQRLAHRGRIIRQLLTEASVISIVGAGMGIFMAFYLVGVIVKMLPDGSFPHEAAVNINLPILTFTVAAALLAGILSGLWPALATSRADLRTGGSGRFAQNFRPAWRTRRHHALIAVQIALTLLMLTGAGI